MPSFKDILNWAKNATKGRAMTPSVAQPAAAPAAQAQPAPSQVPASRQAFIPPRVAPDWQPIVDKRRTGLRSSIAGTVDHVKNLMERRGLSLVPILTTPKQQDPHMLPNATKASGRIKEAIEKGEKIAIFGDDDADGLTATALMYHGLTALGADVEVIYPDSSREYGISGQAISEAVSKQAKVGVTVDVGSSAHKAIADAKAAGIDMIVTDHHKVPEKDVEAFAHINPQLPGHKYYNRDLSGVGVAHGLLRAVGKTMGKDVAGDYLDLVALGTLADASSVIGENRDLISLGTTKVGSQNIGLTALKHAARITSGATTEDLSRKIGPMLNAASRMGRPELALDLLLTKDPEKAQALAEQLTVLNKQRQDLQYQMLGEAHEDVATSKVMESGARAILLYRPDWKPGLSGIIAGQMAETYHRPAIVFAGQGAVVAGSGRAPEGFNLYEALEEYSQMLEQYGGHTAAAGLKIKPERIKHLDRAMEAEVRRQSLGKTGKKELSIEGTVDLQKTDLLSMAKRVRALGPWGTNNPEPVWEFTGAAILDLSIMGRNKDHLRGKLKVGDTEHDFVWFGHAHMQEELAAASRLRIAGTLGVNTFGGEKAQILVKDIIL